MEAIKILRGCGASGKSLEADKLYLVPADISLQDAQILVGMKKAVIATKSEKTEKPEKDSKGKK